MAIILLLAAAIRLAQLNVQSLSMDEVKDLATAKGGWSVIQGTENRFPPLYHAALWGWLQIVPWDETGRGFSVLCGVFTVWVVGRLGRTIGGKEAELWSAGLAAISPFAVWYSVEVRPYSLYLLLGATALWQFTEATRYNRRADWIGFALAACAGAYVHYYFGLLIALAGLAFLASLPARPQLISGLVTFAVLAAGSLPSLWLLKHDLNHPWGYAQTSDFSIGGLGYTYFSFLSGYTLGPSLRELHTLATREAAIAAAPWLAVLGVSTIVLLVQAWRSQPRDRRRRWLAWLVTFALAPPAIIGAVSHVAGLGYNARHAVWSCAPLLALFAVGAARGRPRWLSLSASGVLVAAFAVALVNRVGSDAHKNEDARAVARAIVDADGRSVRPPVFALSGYMSDPLRHYLPIGWPVFWMPDTRSGEDAAERAVAMVREQSPPAAPFWLAYSREFHGDPEGAILKALDEQFDLKLVGQFAGFRLYRGGSK